MLIEKKQRDKKECIFDWIYFRAARDGFREVLKTSVLAEKKILIIGRGETAGRPIAKYLTKNKLPFTVAHSGTGDLKQLTLTSDIIISAVGKPNIVRHDMISEKTVLIGVGLHPENDHLATDYNQEEIAGKALFYTPVPGGVGPVNVAMLMENVIIAAEKSIQR